MEVVLRGETDPVRAEALEGVQAKEEGGWVERGPALAQVENVCVPVVEPLLPIRRDYLATSTVVPSAVR